jgi:hypothetical protein
MPDTSESYTRFENIVILVALVVGFVGSILLYLLDVQPILVSIFLGTGIASLIYRFLGGTTGNSMQLGALKLTGTVAVLIGSSYFINQELSKQENQGIPNEITFQPNSDNWVVLNLDGIPIDLNLQETNQVFKKREKSPWNNLPLELQPETDNKYKVLTSDKFELGVLENSEIKGAGLFSSIEKSDLFVVTPRLKPFSEQFDLDPIPFKLTTQRYGGDYSRLKLVDSNDSTVWDGSIYRKRFEIINLGGRDYFIGVVEVNHDFNEQDSMYAKFALAEILLKNN